MRNGSSLGEYVSVLLLLISGDNGFRYLLKSSDEEAFTNWLIGVLGLSCCLSLFNGEGV